VRHVGPRPPEPPFTVTSVDAAEALATLGSSRRGLTNDEAVAQRAASGPNVLPPPPHRPVISEIAAQFTNMFAVILVVAAGLTFLTYLLSTPRDSANLELTSVRVNLFETISSLI